MNRREFLKVAGVTTAATGAVLATKPKKAFAVELGKEHDQFPLEVTKDFKGFSHKDHSIMRGFWDNKPYDDELIISRYDHHTPVEAGAIFAAKQEIFNFLLTKESINSSIIAQNRCIYPRELLPLIKGPSQLPKYPNPICQPYHHS